MPAHLAQDHTERLGGRATVQYPPEVPQRLLLPRREQTRPGIRRGAGPLGDEPGVRVDAILDSSVVGFDKPDPRFFRAALDRLHVAASRAVHVGDAVPADVRGAQAAGILAVHYDPYDDCDDPGDHEHLRRLRAVRASLAPRPR